MFYDKFIELCDKNNEKPSVLLKQLEFSSGNLKNWKNGAKVNSDILISLSRHFNVSVDCLLGLDNKPDRQEKSSALELTSIEQRLLTAFKELSHDEQMSEIGRIELMAEQAVKAKNTETA
ncbi:MAG: hypothetical protein NC395_07330 [Prevotella sp.]|nr:hypothetical protein [Prevotella sp.]